MHLSIQMLSTTNPIKMEIQLNAFSQILFHALKISVSVFRVRKSPTVLLSSMHVNKVSSAALVSHKYAAYGHK